MKLSFVFAALSAALLFTASCGGSSPDGGNVASNEVVSPEGGNVASNEVISTADSEVASGIASESKTISLTDGSLASQEPVVAASGISSQATETDIAINHSLVAADDDYVFYARPKVTSYIYPQGELVRLDKKSGETKILREGDLPNFLVLSKGWLYFSAAGDSNLYKMSRNGAEEALTTFDSLEELSSMIIVDDYLYCSFQSPSENQLKGIIKVNTSTGEILQLMDSSVSVLSYFDGWLYFNNGDDKWSICKIRTDGSEQTKINDENSVRLNIVGDKLYYINTVTREIASCGLNGEDRMTVSKEAANYRSLAVQDGMIYCGISGDGIYSMDLEGNGVEKLAELSNDGLLYHDIGIASGVVYYEDAIAIEPGMYSPLINTVSLE
ncbi:MAG: DUF5050 domain-containing protein [Clostridiales bacterium]|nr:DUF5050 domain-containing protein [Clostridiales bacterium]